MMKGVRRFFGVPLKPGRSEIDDLGIVSTTSQLLQEQEINQSKLLYWLTRLEGIIGLGNTWRFSYLAYENQGGSFVFCYFIMFFAVGIPTYFMETCLGQFTSKGLTRAFNCAPIARGVKHAMLLTSFFANLYYSKLAATVIQYLLFTIASDLPWKDCIVSQNITEEFNLVCVKNGALFKETAHCSGALNTLNSSQPCLEPTSSSEIYWIYEEFEKGDRIDDFSLVRNDKLVFYVFTWVIIITSLALNIELSPRLSYGTTTIPYILLLALLINNLRLSAAARGLAFFFTPNWKILTKAKVWRDAASQVYFSFTTCTGMVMTMSSTKHFHHNCRSDTWIACMCDLFVSLLVGMTVFSQLGHIAFLLNKDITNAVKSHLGVAFIAYSESLLRMPGSFIFALLFYFMQTVVSMGALYRFNKAFLVTFLHLIPKVISRRKGLSGGIVCTMTAAAGFILLTKGGIYWLHILDSCAVAYSMLFVGLSQLLTVSYIYGSMNFCADIAMMIGKLSNQKWNVWNICWCFISPGVLVVVLIASFFEQEELVFESYVYPLWAKTVCWIFQFSTLGVIGVIALFNVMRQKGSLKMKIVAACKPHKKWRPYEKEHRGGRYDVISLDSHFKNVITSATHSTVMDSSVHTAVQSEKEFIPAEEEKDVSAEVADAVRAVVARDRFWQSDNMFTIASLTSLLHAPFSDHADPPSSAFLGEPPSTSTIIPNNQMNMPIPEIAFTLYDSK